MSLRRDTTVYFSSSLFSGAIRAYRAGTRGNRAWALIAYVASEAWDGSGTKSRYTYTEIIENGAEICSYSPSIDMLNFLTNIPSKSFVVAACS